MKQQIDFFFVFDINTIAKGNMKKSFLTSFFLAIFLLSGCLSNLPESFIRTYDEPGIWRSFEVRKNLTKENLWRTIVDAISVNYDLEVIEKESGYLRTSWKFTYVEEDWWGGGITDRYRSRIVLKFVEEDWKILRVKCESHWMDPNKKSWVMGYDKLLLEDVFGDLQGRIGRIRR